MNNDPIQSSAEATNDPRRISTAKRVGAMLAGAVLVGTGAAMVADTVENFKSDPAPAHQTSYEGIKDDLLNGDHPHQEAPNTVLDEQGNLVSTN